MATVELIENTVVGSGGAASVTFSSLGSYQHLMIVASGRSARDSYQDGSNMRFNGETSGNNQSAVTLVDCTCTLDTACSPMFLRYYYPQIVASSQIFCHRAVGLVPQGRSVELPCDSSNTLPGCLFCL